MKILIIRFSSIGDILLTTPVIRACKIQLGAEITFLTRKKYEKLLEHNPYIDHRLTLEQDDAVGYQNKEYDYILDLQKSPSSVLHRRKYKGKVISFDKVNVRKWVFVQLKLDVLPELHLVDRYFEALSPLGLVYDGEGLDYFFTEDQPEVQSLPDDYIAINCGASYATKRIPNEVVRAIVHKSDLPVVLLGGTDSEVSKDDTFGKSGDQVVNLIGDTTIEESIRAAARSKLLFTSDSFLMHAAAALDIDMVVVWGSTHPKFGMFPLMRKGSQATVTYWQAENLACRPCSKLGKNKCPKGHFKCMMEHSNRLASFEF